MGAYIARQPNGLICRFSSITDTVTDYNLTEQEYIDMCRRQAADEAIYEIRHAMHPYEDVISDFVPRNMTVAEFSKIRGEMEACRPTSPE